MIVDNYPESYSNNPDNGLPIPSWYGDMTDNELINMLTVLERLNQVNDVRPYIQKFVINDKISPYTLFKLIGEPRQASPFENIIDSFNEFKKEAAAFFGFSREDNSTAEDSKENSTNEETDENFDRNSDNFQRVKLKLPQSSSNYMKQFLPDPIPSCESGGRVRYK